MNFLTFKSLGMMTKKEALQSASDDNKKYVAEMIKAEDEDNPEEDLFWDHY